MQVVDLPLDCVIAASWNSNEMDDAMRSRLRRSIQRFGLVVPLVVRPIGDGKYETVGGAQRLIVLQEMGFTLIPCMPVEVDDTEARLLSQALNHIAGSDNLGLRAEALRHILASLPQGEVLAVLPDTATSLQALSSLGQQDIAEHLQAWERAQGARLKHLQFQLTAQELLIVEEALALALKEVKGKGANPNRRGRALVVICRAYLDMRRKPYTQAYRRRAS